jgi:hypothetical protein
MDSYDQKKRGNYSSTNDESESFVSDNIYSPFKIGKTFINNLMDKYLTRKFTEDIDYLDHQGGIIYLNNF